MFWGLLIPIPAFSESLCMRQSFGRQFPGLLERARQTFCILSGCSPLLLGIFPSLLPELHLALMPVVAQGLKCPQGQGSDGQAAVPGLVKPSWFHSTAGCCELKYSCFPHELCPDFPSNCPVEGQGAAGLGVLVIQRCARALGSCHPVPPVPRGLCDPSSNSDSSFFFSCFSEMQISSAELCAESCTVCL